MRDRRVNLFTRQSFEAYREGLKDRLATVCRHMASADFDALTVRMTRIYVRYEPCTGVAQPIERQSGTTGAMAR